MPYLEERVELLERIVIQQQKQIDELTETILSRRRNGKPPMKERIWEYVKAHPGCQTKDLINVGGARCSRANLEKIIEELRKEGKIITASPNPENTGGRRGTIWHAREEEV